MINNQNIINQRFGGFKSAVIRHISVMILTTVVVFAFFASGCSMIASSSANVEGGYITIKGVRYDMSLTELELYDLNLKDSDIKPLKYMTNLKRLVLAKNNITDVTPLADLTELKDLKLENNRLTDIEPLAGLVNLTELNISGNSIVSLEALADLTRLEWLDASGNNIDDVTALSDMVNLTNLRLSGNQISNISAILPLMTTDYSNGELFGTRQLRHLTLDGNPFNDWSIIDEAWGINMSNLDGVYN